MDFTGKRIIVGVSGSIAAYKAPLLVREIIKRGGEVRVVMTPSATQFVSPLALQNLSKSPVVTEMFDPAAQSGGSWHIHLARECDAMIIAPASAATLARLATGLCDTALLTVALSLPPEVPLLVAPAMDSDMWLHPAVQRNAAQIARDGAIVIPPGEGELASGFSGVGRLPDIETLVEALGKTLSRSADTFSRRMKEELREDNAEKDRLKAEIALAGLKRELENGSKTEAMRGKKILITAGPTYEKIDDVRFVGNFSSGKMGFALAAAAHAAGADVTLLAGPVQLPTPEGVRRIDVTSAAEMFAAALVHFPATDCAILAAAVADFTPAAPAAGKLKKEALGAEMTLQLVRTADILATLGAQKKAGQIVVGFALEAEHELENGRKKLHAKNADMIVVNSASKPGSGFQGDDNTITIISKTGADAPLPRMSKQLCAIEILARAGGDAALIKP